MTHEDFKAFREQGGVAGIDQGTAMRLVDHLPRRYQVAFHFWSWAWMLSIPAFILVAIFYKWWVGLLLLFFLTPIMYRAVRQSAAQFVLAHAEGNPEFFALLVREELLVFRSS